MRHSTLPGVVVAIVLAFGASAGASAAGFTIEILPGGDFPLVCSPTGFTYVGGGTVFYRLPAPPGNEIITLTVNGVLDQTMLQDVSPPSGSSVGPINISATFVNPAIPPWVAVVDVFPALGGHAVGTGTRMTATCPGTAPGTLEFAIVRLAAPSIPASSTAGLASLVALLALAGAAVLRRRRASR